MKPKMCPECKVRPLKANCVLALRCLKCANEYIKKVAREYSQEKHKLRKKIYKKTCKKCGCEFEGAINRAYCHNPCDGKRTEHEIWLTKQEAKKPAPYINGALNYSRTKEIPVGKRFTACRG